ncbi:MAG: DUF3151 family protein [Ilumatobacteraceae bacterium]
MTDPSTQPIGLSTGLPSTVIPPLEPGVRHLLSLALSPDPGARRPAVAAFVADHPRILDGWAEHGGLGRDPIEAYAAFRVGYHRGLDALRANGWRGSGYVRWAAASNHGFLRCLLGLQRRAAEIGELDEAERCALFLLQLDPTGVPEEFGEIAPVGA